MSKLYETYLYPTTEREKEIEEKIKSGKFVGKLKKVLSPRGFKVITYTLIKKV